MSVVDMIAKMGETVMSLAEIAHLTKITDTDMWKKYFKTNYVKETCETEDGHM